MSVRKSALLENVRIHFAACTFDTIFYRLNLYRVQPDGTFANILAQPIYLELPQEKTRDLVVVDLRPYDLVVDGDFLVSLEHVKAQGPGSLLFGISLGGKSWFRKTSQDTWRKLPVGLSISVAAQVER